MAKLKNPSKKERKRAGNAAMALGALGVPVGGVAGHAVATPFGIGAYHAGDASDVIDDAQRSKLIKNVAGRDVHATKANMPYNAAYVPETFSKGTKPRGPMRDSLRAGAQEKLREQLRKMNLPEEKIDDLIRRKEFIIGEGKNLRSAAIMAHEAGHAKAWRTPLGKAMVRGRGIGGLMSGIAAPLIAGYTAKKEIESGKTSKGGRAASLATGVLGAAPILGSEAEASIRGYRGLKKLKIPTRSAKIKLPLALASYAAATLIPGVGVPLGAMAYSNWKRKKLYGDKPPVGKIKKAAKNLDLKEVPKLSSSRVQEARWIKVAAAYNEKTALNSPPPTSPGTLKTLLAPTMAMRDIRKQVVARGGKDALKAAPFGVRNPWLGSIAVHSSKRKGMEYLNKMGGRIKFADAYNEKTAAIGQFKRLIKKKGFKALKGGVAAEKVVVRQEDLKQRKLPGQLVPAV